MNHCCFMLAGVSALLCCATLSAEPASPGVVFMEPIEEKGGGALPAYRAIEDPARIRQYTKWLDNDSARWAMDLHDRAWKTMAGQTGEDRSPPYYIALVPDGNHVDAGFVLRTAEGEETFAKLAYMKLGPDPWRFETTILHETGHIVLAALANGDGIPARRLASIPHTTSALSDRGTAFNEGFAIHLETLAAHLSDDPDMRRRYRHEGTDFGGNSLKNAEYFRHAGDLLTFSQTVARYYEVRENNFAFATAIREPDYLRVQLDKSRDFATLRNANQLLQSEGFYASFFFGYTMRGDGIPSREVIIKRQNKMLAVLAEMFATRPLEPDLPYLPLFVETYMRSYPSNAAEIVDVFVDLTHGVFVDKAAAKLWRDFYLAALRLDIKGLPKKPIAQARQRWRDAVMKNPQILYSRLGPQIQCKVPSRDVLLVAFGRPADLSFDINTVQEGIMRTIPSITNAEVTQWLTEREDRPFSSADDFRKRVRLNETCLATMVF